MELVKQEIDELYVLLKSLKDRNWIIDKVETDIIFKLTDIHYKIYGETYDKVTNVEILLCKITKDLCDYIKMSKFPNYRKCSKCLQVKSLKEFDKLNRYGIQSTKTCKDCKLHGRTKIIRAPYNRICSTCKIEIFSGYALCDRCRDRQKEYSRLKRLKR